MSRANGGSNLLFDHSAICIVVITDGINDRLFRYNLSGKDDVRLSRANNSAVLVLVIIFLFAQNVNRSDDISLTIVHIFVMRNVGSCRILPLFIHHVSDAVIFGLFFYKNSAPQRKCGESL